MTNEPADQKARDAIRNDLDVTMMVEAAAGTGKTTNLIARMANLVATGRASASTIAAITFTVKAAAHLREKFQESVERAEKPDERLRAALTEIDRGFIGTTHAFCARLLRERPVEAGLDPEFEELDEPAAVQIAIDFWNRWYAESNAEAIEVGLDRKTLRTAFLRIVDHPDVTFISKRTKKPDPDGRLQNSLQAPRRDRAEPPDGQRPREARRLQRHGSQADL